VHPYWPWARAAALYLIKPVLCFFEGKCLFRQLTRRRRQAPQLHVHYRWPVQGRQKHVYSNQEKPRPTSIVVKLLFRGCAQRPSGGTRECHGGFSARGPNTNSRRLSGSALAPVAKAQSLHWPLCTTAAENNTTFTTARGFHSPPPRQSLGRSHEVDW
jgi:hypothetical protein